MDTPNGDGDRRNLGETEREWVATNPRENAAFGAQCNMVTELPSSHAPLRAPDDAMSSNGLPAACCELA